MRRPAHRGPPTLRPRSGQPCALCRLGGLRACATARRTRVRLRVASRAIRRQSAAVCSAAAPTEAARGYSGRVRRHGLRLSSGASSRNRSASASSRRGAARRIPRYVVGGIPPPRLACAPRPPRRTVRLSRASAGLRALEAASPASKARFLRYLFAARLCLALARRVTAAERGAWARQLRYIRFFSVLSVSPARSLPFSLRTSEATNETTTQTTSPMPPSRNGWNLSPKTSQWRISQLKQTK